MHISCRKIPGFAVLCVHDNGLGIDLKQEKKLFSMFRRLHQHMEGSGIGLFMVKRIVENAGGRIEVNSRLGEGSAFTVYLRQQTLFSALIFEGACVSRRLLLSPSPLWFQLNDLPAPS